MEKVKNQHLLKKIPRAQACGTTTVCEVYAGQNKWEPGQESRLPIKKGKVITQWQASDH